ncbi:RNA methyltransferase [Dechloromonas sp. TW-R-39-2]|uniref:TrmH family RNA methyltransferase n=1 Tax=Dechloromonas sp. TW-R-39-2 TaxID=2654218 RepID=UPI00193C9FDA|nr:RNA methyltransferase [Dechloromonas sp. TW-R-39-2]QRM19641.1 RNA methyltransferase [Dechloromonas sp. TW-R-39-2]
MKLIQSRDNVFFKQLKKLAESGRERRKTGLTLLDGVHLVEAFEAARGPVETLVVAESALETDEISRLTAGRDIVVLADSLMREIGLVDTPSGLLAVVAQPKSLAAVDLENDAVLLDGVQDPGNVGTLLRTAAAAGVRQVLLSSACAAAWSPKVLRAGQGAHFVLDIVEDADLVAAVRDYRGTVAVTCLDGAVSLYEARWQAPLAWIFGAEGLGVSPELIAAADLRIKIPMPGAVESLNVGAAAAICLFEALRRRLD